MWFNRIAIVRNTENEFRSTSTDCERQPSMYLSGLLFAVIEETRSVEHDLSEQVARAPLHLPGSQVLALFQFTEAWQNSHLFSTLKARLRQLCKECV